MLSQLTYPKSREYKSGSTNEPISFFLDVLPESTEFDILLGYFSSSALHILSLGFANFIYKGGKMRMAINHILSVKDKQAIIAGHEHAQDTFDFSSKNIKNIKEALDDYGTHFFNCLAWLIASNRIEIVVIKPIDNKGISHYKSGVFRDGVSKVRFKSSCNFTAYGLLENLEELDIKTSWETENERIAIEQHEAYFESIFSNEATFVKHIDLNDIEEAILTEFGNKEISELLIDESKLLKKKVEKNNIPEIRERIEKLEEQTRKIINEPRFPFPKPREYQEQAYKKWVENDYKGIFAMATGTGKTITSLNCLLNVYKQTGTYKAIILVPTIALVSQWKKECAKFNFQNIITVSSKEKWEKNLSFFNTASKLTDVSFIVIVTYASFVRKRFQSHLNSFSSDTLMIADEMHNMGANRVLKTLETIKIEKRIGLSATPHRQYDEIGNTKVNEFFNDEPPYIFSYTMEDAIKSDPPSLCSYKYHPHIVSLTSEELEKYVKKTKELMRYFDVHTGKYRDCKEVEMLLLARKRIIHKAENKKIVFKRILKEEFKKRGNLKYTLIYAPEGRESKYEISDEYIEDEEDEKIIDQYTRITSRIDDSIFVKQYTSKTKDRDKVIKDFEKGKLDVLCSMKCLDEGVDVPRSELAIFCASTGNPRQFIQRRGRVLRLHKDKQVAIIHDMVVVPTMDRYSEYYNIEKSLIKNELRRVVDFSILAENKIDTYDSLEEILEFYNLNLNDFTN